MNKKILMFVIFVVLLSWIGNVTYYQGQQLNEPLFLKNYCEYMGTSATVGVDFYYLINRSKDINVDEIEIPNLKRFSIKSNYNDSSFRGLNIYCNEMKYTHYLLRKVTIPIEEQDMTNIKKLTKSGPYKIDHIIVRYSNGESKKVEIGEMYFYNNNSDRSVLQEYSSGSSNNSTSFSILRADNSLTIKEWDFYLKDMLLKNADVYVSTSQKSIQRFVGGIHNGESIDQTSENNDQKFSEVHFPIKLNKGDFIKITSKLKPEVSNILYNYFIDTRIIAETKDGKEHIVECNIEQHPSISEKEIEKLVKEMRGK